MTGGTGSSTVQTESSGGRTRMATALLPLIDVDAGERTRAFQRLLDRLTVVRPKQLVLVNPQLVPEAVYDLAAARNGGYYAYPPVGLLYLAAVARSVIPDLDVRIIDLNIELLRRSQEEGFEYRVWQDLLAEALEGCDAPHIAVTYMFGSTKTSFVDVCHFLRERYPNAPILAGGVQCSYDFEEVLEARLADVVFRSDGEGQLEAIHRSSVAGVL